MVHLKRVVVSFCVYLVLLFSLVLVPSLAVYYVRYRLLDLSSVRLLVWYWMPTLQLPIELFLGHLTFLSALERNKDAVGGAIYKFMHWIANKVGVEKYILPYMIRKTMVSFCWRVLATLQEHLTN